MKILVTGGCGFIGSHVVDAYVREGHEVVIIDNLSTGKVENRNQQARLYTADICNASIEEIFKEERPDLVNHHAAQISVPLSVRNPLADAETNIKGTIRLLDLSKTYNVKRFLFASTGGAIYGEADQVPTPENYFPCPASPYAISKFSAENYIRFFGEHHKLNYTVLRYSNVYGPRQIPHGEAGVVAIFTEALLRGELPTLNHFPQEPEGMIRDYCYVKDIAAASIMATKAEKDGVYNIGTAKGTCTLELYRTLLASLRKHGLQIPGRFDEPSRDAARGGDIRVSTLDVRKAKRELGFKALHTLEEGLFETVAWYQKAGQ